MGSVRAEREIVEAPACWRREDTLRIWNGQDEESKKRLVKYRLFNAPFLEEHGIKLRSSANSACERIREWKWSLPEDEDVRMTALQHSGDIREMFSHIPFNEWVREALGFLSASVCSFRGKIRSFSWTLFSYFRCRPEAFPAYLEATVRHLNIFRSVIKC